MKLLAYDNYVRFDQKFINIVNDIIMIIKVGRLGIIYNSIKLDRYILQFSLVRSFYLWLVLFGKSE